MTYSGPYSQGRDLRNAESYSSVLMTAFPASQASKLAVESYVDSTTTPLYTTPSRFPLNWPYRIVTLAMALLSMILTVAHLETQPSGAAAVEKASR